MVREPDLTMQPAPQDNQLMSKHRVLSFKPHLRLERRGQDGQSETEQPDHSASLGDSITASTRIRFSVHTGIGRKPLRLETEALLGSLDRFSSDEGRAGPKRASSVPAGRNILGDPNHLVAPKPA